MSYQNSIFPKNAELYYKCTSHDPKRFRFVNAGIGFWDADVKENLTENQEGHKFDAFCDGDNDVYKFPDGKLYAVDYIYSPRNNPDVFEAPWIWSEVVEVEGVKLAE